MEQVNYGSRLIEYSIKRSKRKKTLAITISSSAQVIVLAPYFVSKERINRIVQKKIPWIFKKQEYFKQLAELFPEKEYISGEQILFLGRKYRLKIKEGEKKCSSVPKMVGRKIFISTNQNLEPDEKKKFIKDRLLNWYFSIAAQIIKPRVERYSKLMNIIPRGIKIKDHKKRWGSCSTDGILRFNWRIAMAPISIVDYVVVHELCHLKIKNHSADFWRFVSLAMPDYQSRRHWLKNNAMFFRI